MSLCVIFSEGQLSACNVCFSFLPWSDSRVSKGRDLFSKSGISPHENS